MFPEMIKPLSQEEQKGLIARINANKEIFENALRTSREEVKNTIFSKVNQIASDYGGGLYNFQIGPYQGWFPQLGQIVIEKSQALIFMQISGAREVHIYNIEKDNSVTIVDTKTSYTLT